LKELALKGWFDQDKQWLGLLMVMVTIAQTSRMLQMLCSSFLSYGSSWEGGLARGRLLPPPEKRRAGRRLAVGEKGWAGSQRREARLPYERDERNI
jgi:hypothetical protein